MLEFKDNADNLKQAYSKQLELIKSIIKKPVTLNEDDVVAVEIHSEDCDIKK